MTYLCVAASGHHFPHLSNGMVQDSSAEIYDVCCCYRVGKMCVVVDVVGVAVGVVVVGDVLWLCLNNCPTCVP